MRKPGRVPSGRRILAFAATASLALLLASCGGGDGPSAGEGFGADEVAGAPSQPDAPAASGDAGQLDFDADEADVAVINAWAEALTAGDLDGAAELFALPSVAENGPATVRLESLAEVRLFNASLPCGAILIGAGSSGDFTTATFRLTERDGPGICGAGTGGEAQVAFVIEDGLIAEWRRVGAGGAQAEGRAT